MDLTTKALDWARGIRVMVTGHYVPAPIAAYFFRQFGAEVIKVEDLAGDHLRRMAAGGDRGMAAMFALLNGGFRSLSIDYRKPEGAAVLAQLMGKCDVVLDGLRVGALARCLGAPPTAVAPHIIYVSVSAYGQVGPLSALAGHDNNVLALGGNLSHGGVDAQGLPTVFSAPVADIFAGQTAAMAAMAALLGKRNTTAATPVQLDASMLHAGFFLNLLQLAERNGAGYQVPSPGRQWHNGARPDYRPYRCADGRCIFFGLLEPHLLKRFLAALSATHLLELDGSAAHAAYEQLFASRDRDAWVALGALHDACITPVNDLEEAVAHPQVQALGRMQAIDDARLGALELPTMPLGIGPESRPLPIQAHPPLLGEDNEALLTTLLGMDAAQCAALRAQGVLAPQPLG